MPRHDTIVCIYCKQQRPRPSKGEHVILKSLGCKTTIYDVCGGDGSCNQLLGDTIDRELARGSFVTIDRMMSGQGLPARLKIPVFGWIPSDEAFVDCAMQINPVQYDVRPQIYANNGRFKVVGGEDFHFLVTAILDANQDWLDRASRRRPALGTHKGQFPPRLVMSKEDSRVDFFLRASNAEAAELFVASLRKELPSLRARIAAGLARERETMSVDLARSFAMISVSPNDPPRCAAKMAFNFLCHHLGAEIALRDEFDPVRSYIRGDDVAPPREAIESNGERGVVLDTRFVSNWMAEPPQQLAIPGLDQGHSITLVAKDYTIGAQVAFFGKAEFQVMLGQVKKDLVVNKPLPSIFLTPLDGSGDRILNLNDIMIMLGLLRPPNGA